MKNKINYKIHIGRRVYKVNEWLYYYFNSVKEKPRKLKNVCNIIMGILK